MGIICAARQKRMELKAKVDKQTVHRQAGGGIVVEKKITGTVKEDLAARRQRGKGAPQLVPASALRELEKEQTKRVRAINQKANEACDKLKQRIAELEGKRGAARPRAARDGIPID